MTRELNTISAEQALRLLCDGNAKFIDAKRGEGDVSPDKRRDTCANGQHPYAIVITCSDSRVIPEAIFSAGIGDLFVIRVAGNVIDNHQLASIEYAASHLGTELVVVLGHTHCGAVGAAIHHEPEGFVRFITDEIKLAIGTETDDYKACCLNINHSIRRIKESLATLPPDEAPSIQVVGAVYDIETGQVEFL